LVGIYYYQRYTQNWRYRSLLVMSNVLPALLSLADIVLFTRLNRRLGIPDQAFVLGKEGSWAVIDKWRWMPGVVINSHLCPKGMEATMYALLAGCHNLGNRIASNAGALVLQRLGSSPSGQFNETKEFDSLWIASLLATILPLCTIVLLPYLIPDARQTDKLLDEEDRDATAGSLWKRWTARPVAVECKA